MKVFVQTGGQSIASWGPTGIPGALIALGLPDEMPIAREPVAAAPVDPAAPAAAPVVEERVVEVEKIIETETIKTQAIVSPLSYLMIIVSFIILVISATLFVTSGNWKFGR